jgi:TP901 family phage tail tape measure protein
MTADVKSFASEFGVLPDEVVPALYSSISAGVPADNVFAFLETSQKLAKGGVTDLATAVDGLSSVVNAYGTDVLSAETASDQMFTAVKLGKTTVDEMASSLFQVTPVAAAFGIQFDEVTASIATLTAQGTPTSVATTQIRGAIAELGKAGTAASKSFEEIAGKTFPQFIEEGGSMTDALFLMKESADENGSSLVDMFGSIEAGQAALGLTKDLEKTTANLDAMRDSAGATDAAFETMNEGLAATMDRIKARLSVAFINIGEAIAPTLEVIGEGLGLFLDLFTKLPGPMQATIVIVATLTAGLIGFAGPILKAITLFSKLSGVMTALAANPWVLAALAIVAVGILIYKNWDTIAEKGDQLWEWFKRFSTAVADDIENAWNRILEISTGVFSAIGDFFAQWWPLLLGIFTGGIGTIIALVWMNWDSIVAKTTEIVGAVVGAFHGAFSAVWGVVSGIGGQVIGFITGIPNAIAGAFSTLANTISAPFRAAFDGIKRAWNATVGGFGFTTPDWIPGLGGKKFTIPSMATGGIAADPMLAMIGDAGPRDPEIVSPVSMMREVVTDALGTAGGAGGITVETHLHVDGLTDEAKFARMLESASTQIVRVVQREIGNLDRGRGLVGQR